MQSQLNILSGSQAKTLKCSILSIGTELTTGQILNRNSHWLAEKIYAYGISPHIHLAVPDDRKLILQALDFCASQSDLLFVTGGLGPTSDDFTREVIAEWSQQPLQWNESAWQHIHNRLIPRGITVKDIQKQQCYFPAGCEILHNELGTAHGFFLTSELFNHSTETKKTKEQHKSEQLNQSGKPVNTNKKVFVLPGPPKEIASIWQAHVASKLATWTADTDKLITHSWDTIGIGESEIAEAVEASLADKKQNADDFEIGYRVHLPFVEVKLSYKKSFSSSAVFWREAVEKAIGQHTVLRDGADAARELTELITKLLSQNQQQNFALGLEIVDTTAGSFLLHRMYPHLHQSKIKWMFSSSQTAAEQSGNTTGYSTYSSVDKSKNDLKMHPNKTSLSNKPASVAISLQLIAQQNGYATAILTYQNQKRKIDIFAPYRTALLKEREAQYWTEIAMIFWLQQLYDLCYTVD